MNMYTTIRFPEDLNEGAPECVRVCRATLRTAGAKREYIFRFDGRDLGRGLYRVDVAGMLGYIWEAIDGGEPVRTLKGCKSTVLDYLTREAEKLQKIPPRVIW